MGTPKEAAPVKYFVGLLSPEPALLDSVQRDLEPRFGEIDGRSVVLPWNLSAYYEGEMGRGLVRCFLSFSELRSPEALAGAKLQTQELEDGYRRPGAFGGGRRINMDPGYLDPGKVVLASTKNACQRIYLRSGIYAEATLLYYDGCFHGCPYTYRDYLWPETIAFLSACRERYLSQARIPGRRAPGR